MSLTKRATNRLKRFSKALGKKLLGIIGYNALRNPTYYYTSKDGTEFEVKPRKDFVIHQLSDSFAQAADFQEKSLWDIKISYSTVYTPIPMQVGQVTMFIPNWTTVANRQYYNGRWFNDAASRKDKAEISRMQSLLDQATTEKKHKLRMRLP